MVHLHASRRWMFNPMWKAAMSNQGRLMEFASLVYSPHRAEPPTRMPEPGASVFVSLSKRRTEPDSLRQFVSKATRLGSRVAFWRWRRISPDACARAPVNWPRVTDDTAMAVRPAAPLSAPRRLIAVAIILLVVLILDGMSSAGRRCAASARPAPRARRAAKQPPLRRAA